MQRADTPEVVTIKSRMYGGRQPHAAWLAPKTGPLGIAPRPICQAIEDKTKPWLNYKIDFLVHLHPKTRTADVVVAPSVSTMILRASSYIPPDVSERNLIACGLQKGGYEVKARPPESRKKKCTPYILHDTTNDAQRGTHRLELVSHEADIMTAAVFAIAKQQRVWGRSQAAAFVGTLKEVLGSCHSLGITVDGVRAIKLQQAITEGKFALPPASSDGVSDGYDVIETFLDAATNAPRPHLCKETTMTDEEKVAMKQKATAKMQSVRWRDPQPLPAT